MFSVLFVCLLLCIPFCSADSSCPSKTELKSCTCRQVYLKPETPLLNRYPRHLPFTPLHFHPSTDIEFSTFTTEGSNNPTTQPFFSESQTISGDTSKSNTESTFSSKIFSNSNSQSPHETTSTKSSSESPLTENIFLTSQSNPDSSGNQGSIKDLFSTEDSTNTTPQQVSTNEIQGRRMGNFDTDDDNDYFDNLDGHSDDFNSPSNDHQKQSGFNFFGLENIKRSYGRQPHVTKPTGRYPNYVKPQTTQTPTRKFYITVVECVQPRTIKEFEEILMFALHRRSVDKLSVSHLPPAKEESLARLPRLGLKNTRIKQFEIRDTALSGDFIWYGSPFEGQAHSLLRICANNCNLYGALTHDDPGTINTKGLRQLPKVEVLDFSINHLTIVKASAFRLPPANLSTIILSRNSLQTLEPGSFSNVTRLKLLDVSHNLLKTVTRSIFSSPANFLSSIDLSENFIEILPVDFFDGMPSLRTVNLSRNFLHSMPNKPWTTVWSRLMHVDVSGNFITCDCQLTWLIPLLSPILPKTNDTTPYLYSTPINGQTIIGSCTFNQQPSYIPVLNSLAGLRRDQLMC
ncbi:hypothetical protein JTE90_009067 [Oedothorax gibbosus]|uniref:Uncharacterized protein n=1 Tax=Oedothorax gibbosus TaxID=931172 RepID=A0AAV6V261_9ARAC|nr:hypothetical protein JTE90_009067 [Oedothorax gibbosus]